MSVSYTHLDVYKRQGLNMERPDLQRMLRAIERRQINLVITKDLSRLGRNYLDVYKRQLLSNGFIAAAYLDYITLSVIVEISDFYP